jgi:hypothetical protein
MKRKIITLTTLGLFLLFSFSLFSRPGGVYAGYATDKPGQPGALYLDISPDDQTATASAEVQQTVDAATLYYQQTQDAAAATDIYINTTVPQLLTQTYIATILATPVPTQETFGRPQVIMDSYSSSAKKVTNGKSFTVTMKISNHGSMIASNVSVSFASGDFIPRGSGGVQSIGTLKPGDSVTITQDLTASNTVEGKTVSYITATISYTDGAGTALTNDATIAFNISATATPEGGSGYSATATPTSSKRPQLVIMGYQSDVNPLQPGTTFQLKLDLQNVGATTAKNVTMVMGGGSASNAGADTGTPAPGGVAGASGEFTNFAPIGASNIQSLGNLSAGDKITANQQLIVNVSTNPGTYPVKFSYLYTGDDGRQFQDDQVITLLVYRLPLVDVNFYRTVDPLTVGMPGTLPIQIVNLSRSSTILGNMTITTGAGEVSNNSMLVGTLDAGGSYPLDVNFTPSVAGPAEIAINLQYTDDFNQPRQIDFKLSVNVDEAPVMEPDPSTLGPNGGLPTDQQPETFWDKVVRFVKGIFGLDSGQPTPTETAPVDPGMNGGGGGGGGGGVSPGGKGSLLSTGRLFS